MAGAAPTAREGPPSAGAQSHSTTCTVSTNCPSGSPMSASRAPAVCVIVHRSAWRTVVLSPVRVATKSMGPPRVLNCPSAWGADTGAVLGIRAQAGTCGAWAAYPLGLTLGPPSAGLHAAPRDSPLFMGSHYSRYSPARGPAFLCGPALPVLEDVLGTSHNSPVTVGSR